VEPSLGAIVIGLTVAVVILVVAVAVLVRRTGRLATHAQDAGREPSGLTATTATDPRLEMVDAIARGLDDLGARVAAVEAAQRRSFQRIGLVRYNPFEETGGNQSFALALLDAAGDGWVLSSLHARSGTRVYAKAITAGRSDATLSAEETDAVQQALV
jgi:hypothetical protein